MNVDKPNTVEPYVRETFTSWLKPPVGSREDIVGIRALPDGRTEYLVKGGFPAYYLAVSAPQPDPSPAKPPTASPKASEGADPSESEFLCSLLPKLDFIERLVLKQDHARGRFPLAGKVREISTAIIQRVENTRVAPAPDPRVEEIRKIELRVLDELRMYMSVATVKNPLLMIDDFIQCYEKDRAGYEAESLSKLDGKEQR